MKSLLSYMNIAMFERKRMNIMKTRIVVGGIGEFECLQLMKSVSSIEMNHLSYLTQLLGHKVLLTEFT